MEKLEQIEFGLEIVETAQRWNKVTYQTQLLLATSLCLYQVLLTSYN